MCRTSCVLASGLAGRGSHSNLYSSSSRRWLLSCSWRTTVSFWSRPLPAVFQTLSAFSPQPPTVLSPAPDSASSLPLSVLQVRQNKTNLKLVPCVKRRKKKHNKKKNICVYQIFVKTVSPHLLRVDVILNHSWKQETYQDCASSLTTLVDAATGAFQSLSLTVGSVAKTQRV